ncbi:MAG: outer membrane beta-barrel protein [Candidatus Omnitrophica bacterium]|nr:outer membrane beta-barrel protein [Candidatus Omnitrophota bacterium]
MWPASKKGGAMIKRGRLGALGALGLLGCLVWLGTVPPVVVAEEQELQIGLPDFPRRVRRTLPELKPEQEIRVGILKLHPSFRSAIQFDDNIRLASSGEESTVIFQEKPGIIGEVKLGDHRLEAGYGIEILSFAGDSAEDSLNHLAHGQLDLNLANNFSVTTKDTFERNEGRLFTETTDRDKININTLEILGRYDRPMWALEGGWTYNLVDHDTAAFESNDYDEHVLAILGGYKIFPKTLWLVETDVGFIEYDANTTRGDHTYWQILTGLRGELTSKVTSTIKVGFQNRDFDNLATAPGDADEFVADAELVYSPTTDDVARLEYLRTLRTSTYATNHYYRQDKIALSYRKRFARKWLVTPRFSWQLNDYHVASTEGGVTKEREDDFFQVGLDLRYELKEWLSSGIAYNFRTRNSNFGTFDYDNNRYTFDVTLAF